MPTFNINQALRQNLPPSITGLEEDFKPITARGMSDDDEVLKDSQRLQHILAHEVETGRVNEEGEREARSWLREVERQLRIPRTVEPSRRNREADYRSRQAALNTKNTLRAAALGRDTLSTTSWGQYYGSALESKIVGRKTVFDLDATKEEWERMIDLLYGGPVNPSAQSDQELEAAGYTRPLMGNFHHHTRTSEFWTNTLPQSAILSIPMIAGGAAATLAAPAAWPAAGVAAAGAVGSGAAGFLTEGFFTLGEAYRHNVAFQDALSENGIDPMNREEYMKAMEEPGMKKKILTTMGKKVGPVVAADMLSFGALKGPRALARAFVGGAPGRTARNVGRTIQVGGQVIGQAALEAGGEAGGQWWAYDRISYDEVAMEGLVGGGMGIAFSGVEYGLHAARKTLDKPTPPPVQPSATRATPVTEPAAPPEPKAAEPETGPVAPRPPRLESIPFEDEDIPDGSDPDRFGIMLMELQEDHIAKGEHRTPEELVKEAQAVTERGVGIHAPQLQSALESRAEEEALAGTEEDSTGPEETAPTAPDSSPGEGEAAVVTPPDLKQENKNFMGSLSAVWGNIEGELAPVEIETESDQDAGTAKPAGRFGGYQRRANRQRKGLTDNDDEQAAATNSRVAAKAIVDTNNSLREARQRAREATGMRDFLKTLGEVVSSASVKYESRVPRNRKGARKMVHYMRKMLGNRGGIWVDARIVSQQAASGNKALANATGLRTRKIKQKADTHGYVLIPFETLAEDILRHGSASPLVESIPDNDSKFRVNQLTVNQGNKVTKNIIDAAEARKQAKGPDRDKLELVEFLTSNYMRAGTDPDTARKIAMGNAEILAAVAAVSNPEIMRRENWVRFITGDMTFFEGGASQYDQADQEVERIVSVLAVHADLKKAKKSIESGQHTAEEANITQAHVDTMELGGKGAWGPAVQQDLEDVYLGGLNLDDVIEGPNGGEALRKLTYGEVWRALMIGRVRRAWNTSTRERQEDYERHWTRMHGPSVGSLVDYFNTAKTEKERESRLKDVLRFYDKYLDRKKTDQKLVDLLTAQDAGIGPEQENQRVDDASGVHASLHTPGTGTSGDYTALFASADPITIIHEFGHQVLTALSKAAQAGALREDVKTDLETFLDMSLERFSRIANTNDDDASYAFAQESFAEGLEHYMVTGKIAKNVPENMRIIFAAIARALANVYARLTNVYRTNANNRKAEMFFNKLLAAAEAARRDAQDQDTSVEPRPGLSEAGYAELYRERELRHLAMLEANLDPDSKEDGVFFDRIDALAGEIVELREQNIPKNRIEAWMTNFYMLDEFNKDDWLIIMPNRAPNPDNLRETRMYSFHAGARIQDRFGGSNVMDVEFMRDGAHEANGFLITGVSPKDALTQSGHHVAFTRDGWIRSDGNVISERQQDEGPMFGPASMSNPEYFVLPNGQKFSMKQRDKRAPTFTPTLKQRRAVPLQGDDAAHKAELTSGPKYSEKRVEPFVQNILQLFDRIPEDLKSYAKARPQGLNDTARALATKHKRTLPQTAAVLAVFARNASWDSAINGADRFLSLYRKTRNPGEIVQGFLDKKWLKTQQVSYHPNGEIDGGAPTGLQRPSPHVPEFVHTLVQVLATQDTKPVEGEEAITIGNSLPQTPVLRARFNMIMDPTDAESVPVSLHAREAIALGQEKHTPKNNFEAAFIMRLAADRAGVSANELNSMLEIAWPKLQESLNTNSRIQEDVSVVSARKISREQKATDTLDILPDPPSAGEVLGASIPQRPRKPKILRQQRDDTQATDESWKNIYPVDPKEYPGITTFPPDVAVPPDFLEALEHERALTYDEWYNGEGSTATIPNWVHPRDNQRIQMHPDKPVGEELEIENMAPLEREQRRKRTEVGRAGLLEARARVARETLGELEQDSIEEMKAQIDNLVQEKRAAEARGDGLAREEAALKSLQLEARRKEVVDAILRTDESLDIYAQLTDAEHVKELGITPEWAALMRQVFGWYGALVKSEGHGARYDNPLNTLEYFNRMGVVLQANLLPSVRANPVTRIQNLAIGDIDNLRNLYEQMLAQGRRNREVPLDLKEAIGAFNPLTPDSILAKRNRGWLKKAWEGFGAFTRIPENLFVEMDGGEFGGTIWTHLFKPLNKAQDAELELRGQYTGRISGILKAMRKDKNWAIDPLYPDTTVVDRETAFMIAVNMGTHRGMENLLNNAPHSLGLRTDKDIKRVVDNLSLDDWNRVHKIWNIMGEMYDHLATLDKDHFGTAPVLLTKTNFIYNPVDVPPDPSVPALRSEGGMFQAVWEREDGEYESQDLVDQLHRTSGIGDPPKPTIGNNGELVPHTDLYGRRAMAIHEYDTPFAAYENLQGRTLDLSVGALYKAVSKNVHTITHRAPVAEVGFLLSDAGVGPDLANALTKEHLAYLRSWLVDISGGAKTPNDWQERLFRTIRLNASVAIIGLNVRSAAQQIFGYMSSAAHEPGFGGHIAEGIRQSPMGINLKFMEMVANSPIDGRKPSKSRVENRYRQMLGKYHKDFQEGDREHASLVTFVKGMSPFMRKRTLTAQKEFLDLELEWFQKLHRVTSRDWKKFRERFWYLTRMGDQAVSIPVWSGVFKREMEAGKEIEDAVEIADHAVRVSQGSGRMIDRSRALRGGDFTRMNTMFMTALNAIHNLHTDAVNAWQRDSSAANSMKLVKAHMLLIAVPALIMAGVFDDRDDDEAFWEHFLWSYGGAILDLRPFAREAGGIIMDERTSMEPTVMAAPAEVLKNLRYAAKSKDGYEFLWNMLIATIVTAGFGMGFTSIQAKRLLNTGKRAVLGEYEGSQGAKILHGVGDATGIRGVKQYTEE